MSVLEQLTGSWGVFACFEMVRLVCNITGSQDRYEKGIRHENYVAF